MIIKILLTGVVVLLAVWLLANRSKAHARAGTRLVMIGFAIIAIIAIVFPDVVTRVAQSVGVGRGADLILYLLTMLFLFFSLNYYIRTKDEQSRLVALTRRIAILEANESNHNKQVLQKKHGGSK